MSRSFFWILALTGVLAIAAFVINPFFFGLMGYIIPTSTMENTLLVGDRFLVVGDTSVERGDIIAYYSVDRSKKLVHRVVGVPGDHIRIMNKQLMLNGKRPVEPYAVHKTDYLDSYRDNFPSEPPPSLTRILEPAVFTMLKDSVRNGEVIVPQNSYFVLGDNRDNSFDSRFAGLVRKDHLMGKPWLIYARQHLGLMFKRINGYPLGR